MTPEEMYNNPEARRHIIETSMDIIEKDIRKNTDIGHDAPIPGNLKLKYYDRHLSILQHDSKDNIRLFVYPTLLEYRGTFEKIIELEDACASVSAKLDDLTVRIYSLGVKTLNNGVIEVVFPYLPISDQSDDVRSAISNYKRCEELYDSSNIVQSERKKLFANPPKDLAKCDYLEKFYKKFGVDFVRNMVGLYTSQLLFTEVLISATYPRYTDAVSRFDVVHGEYRRLEKALDSARSEGASEALKSCQAVTSAFAQNYTDMTVQSFVKLEGPDAFFWCYDSLYFLVSACYAMLQTFNKKHGTSLTLRDCFASYKQTVTTSIDEAVSRYDSRIVRIQMSDDTWSPFYNISKSEEDTMIARIEDESSKLFAIKDPIICKDVRPSKSARVNLIRKRLMEVAPLDIGVLENMHQFLSVK